MRLTDYLPYRYRGIEELVAVLEVETPEAEAWRRAVRDLLAQANINTATWGLDYYEERYGLPIAPAGESYESRRAFIRAKRRAFGVIDEEVIEQICREYLDGDAKCTSNRGDLTITVQFLGELGRPENLDKLYAFLRTIIASYVGMISRFAEISYTQRLGCAMTMITSTPVPMEPDVFDFREELHLGGAVGSIVSMPVPREADKLDLRTTLNMGGHMGAIVSTPLPEIKEV